MKYIGALDLGTTSVRFIIFDGKNRIVASSQKEHKQIYPREGWVEHNPMEILYNTQQVINDTIKKIDLSELAGIGITNQRETIVAWNKNTGKPYYNAIVWQDIRTAQICRELKSYEKLIKEKTGLPIATYFSATKMKWLLENVDDIKKYEVIFGTIDSWIVWNLTGGTDSGIHITDVTNASRTMLMNLSSLEWDDELLSIFSIKRTMLPTIKSSSEIYGYTKLNNYKVPIAGILGDQQAALFGHRCFKEGDTKNTYGTGCFLLMNTKENIIQSKYGLITTVAYKIGKSPVNYALEGSIAVAGSLIQWIRDNLNLIDSAGEINELAGKVSDSGGVYFVPAFSGLFAPYWDSSARGIITGLTHYVNKNHIARAALEAVAFQTRDIFEAMEKDSNMEIKSLKTDGGMTKSDILMQFQADILKIPVIKSKLNEITALGAAYVAGLSVGFYNKNSFAELETQKFLPKMGDIEKEEKYKMWKKALKKSKGWIDD